MTNSLGDILRDRAIPQEPPEIAIIKRYLAEKYDATARVQVSDRVLIIGVNNASLAATLRLESHLLQEKCGTNKRLIIRII